MSTTINAQNALQIRERPMDVYVSFQTGSSAKITTYTPTSSYKSYDSTLGDSSIAMRNLADLAGDGFPLDGSCQFYEAGIAPSPTDGKLGLRGVAGQNLTLTISAAATLTAITIATRNAGTITVNGVTGTATGLNVFSVGSTTANITVTPESADARAEIDYIVPGIILEITNDNLISCNLALRSNLDVDSHSWEESEIQIEMYYPYSIADSFAYVMNEWPITYKAGYDSDLSIERKFYLSEPIEQVDNVITIKGVDASHLLENSPMLEHWIESYPGAAHATIYDEFINAIRTAGIKLQNRQSWTETKSGARQVAIVPEMSARDFVSGVMNLTLNHKRGATYYGIQFVDAGIPSVEHGDGKTYGNTWTINKSDVGDFTEIYEQNISKITNPNDERKYNETVQQTNKGLVLFSNVDGFNYLPPATNDKNNYAETIVGQEVSLSFDGYFSNIYYAGITANKVTPSEFVGNVYRNSSLTTNAPSGGMPPAYVYTVNNYAAVSGRMATISGGYNSFSNPNQLPGREIDIEPFIYGNITDGTDPVFNYPSLFNRANHTVSFTWKGDPRMQPLDYINIVDDTVTPNVTKTYRATLIELSHDGGGTVAKIEAREWT